VCRTRDGGNPEAGDMLDLILLGKRAAGETWSAELEKQLCYELKTFLLAGHETSASMLTLTLLEVLHDPVHSQRILAEADAVLGAPGSQRVCRPCFRARPAPPRALLAPPCWWCAWLGAQAKNVPKCGLHQHAILRVQSVLVAGGVNVLVDAAMHAHMHAYTTASPIPGVTSCVVQTVGVYCHSYVSTIG